MNHQKKKGVLLFKLIDVRSIIHKLGHLNVFVHDFDISCFTESHLDSTVGKDDLPLDGLNTIL